MFPIGIKSFSQLLSTEWIIVHLVLCALNSVALMFASVKFILAMQQSGYKTKRFFKWLKSPETPYLSRLMLLCLLGFLFFLVLNTCFSPLVGVEAGSFIGFISYFMFLFLYIKSESAVNAKIPLRKTRRLITLCVTYTILLALSTFLLIILFNYLAYILQNEMLAIMRYALICGMPILLPYILYLAFCINQPFETFIKRKYLKRTAQKLDNANLIKIGITGSYGKTSVKEILKTILSVKYRVLASPASYNTSMGICLTVNGLDNTHDVLIAEMGARNVGDIKVLADLVKPKYAILTGVNNQHLESFKSYENILKAKNELFESLPSDGVGFFSADNEGAKILYEKCDKEKYFAGISGGDVCAENLKINENGTDFTLKIQGEKPINCTTGLLGKHSISNICLAVSLAHKLGLTPKEIALGINRIQTVNHRLELVPNNKGIVLIDDSYNSNEDGIKSAMEVLDTFKGRKIVLTPGLVELGKRENIANFEFGKTLAKHADMVIVIGKHNAEMIIQGLLDGGMNRENVMFAKTLNKGNVLLNGILKKGDVVLFENDLPDNYS